MEFARAEFKVTGLDTDEGKIDLLKRGTSYVSDVKKEILTRLIKENRFMPTSNHSFLEEMDFICICTPTPLNKSKEPDISYIIKAAEKIAENLQEGQVVSLESTTYPGTTEEVVLPILEKSGLKVGKDFYLVFSPERIDPGNKEYTLKNTPKILGGVTENCAQMAKKFYREIVTQVVAVSSPKAAELAKLLENIFRSVNIALVNELTLLCDRMGMDIWEVIQAASTKPFGFMSFHPGPGLGGHCIPVDPYYLSWKARQYDFHTRFIELAGEVNSQMPYHVVDKVAEVLNRKKRSLNNSKILILGLSYKKDVPDTRYSPALTIIGLLKKKGAEVFYNDPYIPRLNEDMHSLPLREELLRTSDCVLIVTDHTSYDWGWIVAKSNLIVDTRYATKNAREKDKIYHL